MTLQRKFWVMRLASIPVLLLFPIACIIIGGSVFPFKGDNFPGGIFVGLLSGIIGIVPLSRRTLFAGIDQIERIKVRVAVIAAFDILALPLGHLIMLFHDV